MEVSVVPTFSRLAAPGAAPARLHPRLYPGDDPQGIEQGQLLRAERLHPGRCATGLVVGRSGLELLVDGSALHSGSGRRLRV